MKKEEVISDDFLEKLVEEINGLYGWDETERPAEE